MPATTGSAQLSAEEISALLALTKQADTVELKLTVPESRTGYRSTIAALEMDPMDAQMRQVFFFDTPDLFLNKHGVVARARRSQGGVDDSVVAWLYPDGTRIVELSTKCQPSETFQVANELKAFLTDRGVDITGEQQTKTATALKFFSKELRNP